MGIEPTRDFFKPHTGFEDQERHQAAGHLQHYITVFLLLPLIPFNTET